MSGRNDDELRLAGAVIGEAEHLVADAESVDVVADLGHDARHVAALPGRKRCRPTVVQRTAADHRLTGIDRSRLHLDEDLTSGGHRFRDVAYLQDIGLAIPIELHCLAHRGYDRE
jgi:hypothetical protein